MNTYMHLKKKKTVNEELSVACLLFIHSRSQVLNATYTKETPLPCQNESSNMRSGGNPLWPARVRERVPLEWWV